MSLGNYNNNEKDQKPHAPEIYSFSMANREGVDPSKLSMSFTLGLLKIQISPKKPNSDRYDYQNCIAIYLTHTKAKMLLDQIRKVMSSPEELASTNNIGVNTKSDMLISFSNGKELGIDTPALIIRKIENGEVTMSYAYQFGTTNYVVKNFDQNKIKMEKEMVADQEIIDFCTVLEEYYKARTFAVGFSVHESGIYTKRREQSNIESIMEKLGIEKPNYSRGGGSSNRQSFFDSQNSSSESNNSSYRQTTLDDFDQEMMNPPEED